MNAIATVVGYITIWAVVALAVAIPLGKFIGRKRNYTPEFEFEVVDRDLSKRPPFGAHSDPDALFEPSRYALPPRRFDDEDLRDLTPSPNDPAS